MCITNARFPILISNENWANNPDAIQSKPEGNKSRGFE